MSEFSSLIDSVQKRDKRLHHHALTPKVKLYDIRWNIRLDKDMDEKIRLAAAKDGTNVAQKVREYIEWGLENEDN